MTGSSAADALSGAVDRLAGVPGHRLDHSDHERLLVRVASLATDAAAACRNGGDDSRVIECLEAGRGILLAKTLRNDRTFASLRRCDAALADRLQQVQTLLATGPGVTG